MRVRVTMAGMLEDYLPAGSDGAVTVETPPETTLLAVMQAAGIPGSAKPLISLNGTVVPRSQHAGRTVTDGDQVHFMPNLKGG
ncbi:MAG: MoaD/ThiS family protein [Thiotrichales bacterium]|nr:MoaD/ThiS family protein [Thiotrichales bacterium]